MNGNDAKKMKLDQPEAQNLLNQFEFVRILNEESLTKKIIILAKHKTEQNEETNKAVFILMKSNFNLEEVKSYLSDENSFEIQIENDIYKKLSLYPLKPYNSVEVQTIYPATQGHIEKYSAQESYLIKETYEDWVNITLKYIESSSFSIQWVYNILEHKTEKERIVYEDPDPKNGFILLPDMKWDGKVESMYLLAIIHQKDIRSIRDLNGSHIELLENVVEKGLAAIKQKYNVSRNKIRVYFHYFPSFYHLHVHFTHINFEASSERNYSIFRAIENLKLDGDYFKKVALEIPIRKNEKLFELFKHKIED